MVTHAYMQPKHSYLYLQGVRASILIGILFVTFISWIPSHEATYFRDQSSIPGGEARYWFFRKVRLKLIAL
jgi:AGZA family xanthine/uracil permease-like MFS transporter